jgi:hypothetical protein
MLAGLAGLDKRLDRRAESKSVSSQPAS